MALSVLDILRCLTGSLGGRYYSIKKDKYCNGAFTGHSLDLVGLQCMDSISCLVGSFT